MWNWYTLKTIFPLTPILKPSNNVLISTVLLTIHWSSRRVLPELEAMTAVLACKRSTYQYRSTILWYVSMWNWYTLKTIFPLTPMLKPSNNVLISTVLLTIHWSSHRVLPELEAMTAVLACKLDSIYLGCLKNIKIFIFVVILLLKRWVDLWHLPKFWLHQVCLTVVSKLTNNAYNDIWANRLKSFWIKIW